MEFKILKSASDCKRAWNYFNPNQNLFDVWDYRYCFFNKDMHRFNFILGKYKRRIDGLLPLIYNRKEDKYEFFGSWFPEPNFFYIMNKLRLTQYLNACPERTNLKGIHWSEKKYYNFEDDEPTYFLDLLKYKYDYANYMNSFSKKRQKNLRQELKPLLSSNHRITYNNISNFSTLVNLNIRQFGDQSNFMDPYLKKSLRKLLLTVNRNNIVRMISLKVGRKIEAVDFCVIHNNRFYPIAGGANIYRYPNLGKFMTMLDIQSAINEGARFIEFLATFGHWKRLWHFESGMLLKYAKDLN